MVSASKDCDDADNEHRREEPPPAVDDGNSSSGSSPDDTVVVLVVPQRWTKEAYALASSHGLVARRWHLDGRYGSRTHRVSEEARTTGFPLLPVSSDSESSHRRYERLLSRLPGGSAVAAAFAGGGSCYLKPTLVRDLPPLRAPVPDPVDATVHPERRPKGWSLSSALAASSSSSSSATAPAFTFVELFAGVGGFGVALQELGGACVLASEIDDSCARTFRRNVRVPVMDRDATRLDADDVPPHDLLVAGFPCQPFSALGTQTGISGDDGRGTLYRHIVRVLRRRRPRAFLLENVPGLAVSNGGTDLASILEDTRASGYDVTTEVCSSRALTAQSRKRLYFVGVRSDLASSSSSSGEPFRFPFQPDLGLRAGDVLDTPENVAREEAAILAVAAPDKIVVDDDDDDGPDDVDSSDAPSPSLLALTPSQFSRLRRNKRWKPARLAWPDTVCDTLDSHYGNSVGRGGAQLVPRPAPSAPRRFSPSECARIMGFCPETFRTNPPAPDRGAAAHLKERYREFGNAVCPPVVAAIGGAVLRAALSAGRDAADADARRPTIDWEERGRTTAVRLALRAVAPHRREAVRNRLSSSSSSSSS